MAMKRLKISAGGQVSVPASVRHRWQTNVVIADDRGDHMVLRPAPEDPIAVASGAFADHSGPSADEMRRMDLDEELQADTRATHQ
jgi:bifunctional DNA-binding transcriptional regulator/antitoxin component of YhaV-PrlF toxin-antitoxin module